MDNGSPLRSWAQTLLTNAGSDALHALREACEDPESAKKIHASRKALALLEAAFADLSPLAPGGIFSVRAAQELHRRAGKVRDADVLRKRLKEYSKKAAPEELSQIAEFKKVLKRRRKRAVKKLRRSAGEFFSNASRPAPGSRDDMRKPHFDPSMAVSDAIAAVLRLRTAEMLHAAPAMDGSDDGALHAFRLRCKQLRYALQRFGARRLGLKPVESGLGELVDALGAAHDCTVLARRAADCGCRRIVQCAKNERRLRLEDATWIWITLTRPGGELEALTRYAGLRSSVPA